MTHDSIWRESVEPNIAKGAAVLFAHGFSVHYGCVTPRRDIDAILVAPKGPGDLVRRDLASQHGQCERLVPQRAAGAPDPNRKLVEEHRPEELGHRRIPGFDVSEELADVDREHVQERLTESGVLSGLGHERVCVGQPPGGGKPVDAPPDLGGLVLGQVYSEQLAHVVRHAVVGDLIQIWHGIEYRQHQWPVRARWCLHRDRYRRSPCRN